MKILKYIAFFFLLGLLGTACEEDNSIPQLEGIPAPDNISALFTIANDNSGRVSIRPDARGVTQFTVDYGDGSGLSEPFAPGQSTEHVYTEGSYPVTIMAMGVNGKVTEYTQELTVAFEAPQNLVVDILPVPGDPFSFDVSATADLETFFEVTFGEIADEVPQPFMEGETVRYTYAEVGTYEITVTARSGGAASLSQSSTITVSNPILMPIDFENPTLSYTFTNFGGAGTAVVDNPDVSEGNVSSRVAELAKGEGSEVWAGSFIELGEPIDFSAGQKIRMKVWSPQAGIPILLKLENLENGGELFHEVTVTNTAANAWEELIFDFAEADFSFTYQRVVVFFDFGTNGTGASYYFDDIEVTDGSAENNLPMDFESPDINYEFIGFGGASAEVIANPDASGANSSANVAALSKSEGSEVWAGVLANLSSPINFGAQQKIRMKTWSPTAGINVLLKVENLDNADIFYEVQVQNTVANAWEELEFDFSGIDIGNSYQRIVVFFDFGTNGTGATYYFDEITLAD